MACLLSVFPAGTAVRPECPSKDGSYLRYGKVTISGSGDSGGDHHEGLGNPKLHWGQRRARRTTCSSSLHG